MKLVDKILKESEEDLFKPRKINDREKQLKKENEKIINKIGIDKFKNIFTILVESKYSQTDPYYNFVCYIKAKSELEAETILNKIVRTTINKLSDFKKLLEDSFALNELFEWETTKDIINILNRIEKNKIYFSNY